MKNQREIKKKDPEFYRKLLALLIPMVVQNLMNALVSASDALMVGTLDQNSLSAVSLATQISVVLNLFYALAHIEILSFFGRCTHLKMQVPQW